MKENRHRIIQNSMHILSMRFVSSALSLILIIFITRYLGKEEMGKYSFVFSFFTLYAMIANLGIEPLITRKIAEDKQRTNLYLNHYILLGLSVSIVISGSMILAAFLLNYSSDIFIGITVLALVIGCNTVFSYLSAAFSAYEKFSYANYLSIALMVSRATIGLILLFLRYHYLAQVVVFAATQVAAAIAALIIIDRKISPLRFDFNWELMKQDFHTMRRFSSIALVYALFSKIDVILISKLKDMGEVAVYSAAYNIFELTQALPLSIIFTAYPVLSRLYNVSHEEMLSLFKKVFSLLIFVVTSVIFSMFFISSRVIVLFYGNKFIKSSDLLIILTAGLIPWSLCCALGFLFRVKHLEIYDLYANILGVIVNLMLNILLIPLLGSKGAALAFLVSISFMLIYGFFVCKNNLSFNPLGNISLYRRPLIAAFWVGLCSFIFRSSPLPLQLFICAVIFMALATYYLKLPRFFSLLS